MGILICLILAGEMTLHVLEEAILIPLEFLEKFVDIGYETLGGLDSYASQKATAWTGAVVFVALLIWGGYKLKKLYHRAMAAAPTWWEAKKAQMREEWRAMSWKEKAGYMGSVIAMFGLLSLFI
jgi:hypothetical protein